MLTDTEALERILSAIPHLPSHPAPLGETLRRHAARDLFATVPLPGFDNSAMDGYAVRAADTARPDPIRVTGEQPAGRRRELTIGPGEAIRIFTGAPMPGGADAVIMQEDVNRSPDGTSIVCVEPVEHHENVRVIGCDLCAGQKILEKGQRLTAARIGLLAAQGLAAVDVAGEPRVAVVTTGDELVSPGTALAPGQIYNSNGVMVQAMLRELGVGHVSLRHVPDDAARTTEAVRDLVPDHDFLIFCGGVSVGDHDHVRPALETLGIQPTFWRVKIKPGKPLLFTQAPRQDGRTCTLFGLPGNPVSSYVTFQLFVRPALLKAMGAGEAELKLPRAAAVLAAELRNPGDRPHYIRGHFEDGRFTPQGGQRSHELSGLANSNALLRMEPASTLEAGAAVSVLLP